MDVRRRLQNEKKSGNWEELSTGGRRYWYEVDGHSGWKAKYCKEVDSEELTVSFHQEIYDESWNLRQIHRKYQVDLGHQEIGGDE